MSNNSLIFLCTYMINKSVISEYKKLVNSYPEKFDVILVINNEEVKLDLEYGLHEIEFFGCKIKCLLFDKKLNDTLNLRCYAGYKDCNFAEAMWYNSDYRYYYVKHFLPDYEYYWYTEYDVYCNGESYKPFLKKYEKANEDLLIPHFRKLKKDDDWMWIKNTDWIYKNRNLYGSFFPISRLSARAVDFLYRKRVELGNNFQDLCKKINHEKSYEKSSSKADWIFCELFVPTEVIGGGYSADKIEEENIRQAYFDLNEDRIFENPDYKIYHPVKTISQIENNFNKKVNELEEKIKNLSTIKFKIFGIKISYKRKI